jgi:hypothetical protein
VSAKGNKIERKRQAKSRQKRGFVCEKRRENAKKSGIRPGNNE